MLQPKQIIVNKTNLSSQQQSPSNQSQVNFSIWSISVLLFTVEQVVYYFSCVVSWLSNESHSIFFIVFSYKTFDAEIIQHSTIFCLFHKCRLESKNGSLLLIEMFISKIKEKYFKCRVYTYSNIYIHLNFPFSNQSAEVGCFVDFRNAIFGMGFYASRIT